MTTQIPSRQVGHPRRIVQSALRSCLTLVLILVAIYLLHAVYVLGRNHLYQLKWQKYGSLNYRAVITLRGIFPLAGTNTITVEGGKVIAATNNSPFASQDLQLFGEFTIENIFTTAISCAKYFPFELCTLVYDKQYGYPKHVVTSCPFPDCWRDMTVDEVELLDP